VANSGNEMKHLRVGFVTECDCTQTTQGAFHFQVGKSTLCSTKKKLIIRGVIDPALNPYWESKIPLWLGLIG
jgi:hypothetical protein